MRSPVVPLVFAGLAFLTGAASPPARDAGRAQPPLLPFAVPGAPRPPGFDRPAPKPPKPEPGTLREVLTETPADSLDGPLKHFEVAHGRSLESADAAFTLGQFHYARGEYKQAAEAYARASARYPPDRKAEARYWQGLAALGQGDATQARSVLGEVAEVESPRRAAARYAVAEAWLRAGRIEPALDQLRTLLADRPDEMKSEALERTAELARRLGDDGEAERATRELEKLSPRAVEPVRRPSPPPIATVPVPGPAIRGETGRIAVQIGAFSDLARARALFESARQAGYPRAQLLTQGRGGATLHVVRIGLYPNEGAARAAGEHASRELGVAYRLIRNP